MSLSRNFLFGYKAPPMCLHSTALPTNFFPTPHPYQKFTDYLDYLFKIKHLHFFNLYHKIDYCHIFATFRDYSPSKLYTLVKLSCGYSPAQPCAQNSQPLDSVNI